MDFLRKYRHVLAGLLILFVALQIPIYWKQDRSLGLPARVFYTLAYYPQSGWATLTEGVRSVTSHYLFLVSVAQENDRLKKQNAELRGKLHELREVSQENLRLRSLLEMRERSSFDGVGARIIALDSSSWFQSFTIDVGSDDGVAHGMPVVSDEGLVGSVVSVAAKSSKVLPIVDMNSAVDVVASRSRARGILVGRGRERAFVNYLERSEDVKEGDLLVTSGLGGAFPPGLPVAVIREVREKTYGLFQDAFVDTIARFSRLENLMVLRYSEGERIPHFVPPPAPDDVTAAVAVTEPAVTLVEEIAAPAPVIPAEIKPAPIVKPVAPKKPIVPKPAPVSEAVPVTPPPIEGGSPFMGGAALNLPSMESAMPAVGAPDDDPVKPAAPKPATATPKPAPVEPVAAPAAAPAKLPAKQVEKLPAPPPPAAVETEPFEPAADMPAPVTPPPDEPLSGGTP